MSNVLSQFLAGSQAGMNAQNFRDMQALRQQQAERETETYGLNKAVNNARILKGAMDAIERVSPDANVRYETAMRMRPQLEKLGVTDIPFDQLTPEDFSPEKFNIHKQSIAGFIQDPQQQMTAYEIRRNQILKDLKSPDKDTREMAELEIGRRGRATTKKIVTINGVQHIVDADMAETTPLTTVEDEATNRGIIKEGEESGKQNAKAIAELEQKLGSIEQWDVFYAKLPGDLRNIKNVPGSKLESALNSAFSSVFGNTKAADAQAKFNQVASIILGAVPYSPGAQSNIELQQRAEQLSDQIKSSNLSIDAKIEAIKDFVRYQERIKRGIEDQIKKRKSAGLGSKVAPQGNKPNSAGSSQSDELSELEQLRREIGDLGE